MKLLAYLPIMPGQDYSALVKTHRELDADITISTYSVPQQVAAARGLVRVDPESGHSHTPLPHLDLMIMW